MGSSSKDKGHRGHKKKRNRSKSKEREESRRHQREESPSPAKRSKRNDEPEDIEEGEVVDEPVRGGGDDVSLSIEETNKLRAKLGLKPLEVGGGEEKDSKEDEEKSYDKRGEVFVKTEKISDKIEAEKLKERITTQKEKRKIIEKLSKVKGLAESSDSEDDAKTWVQKNRELEKRKAEQKAKELEEMEAEIERQQEELIRRQFAYKDQHLKGLTVGHSIDSIKEGSQVILTLKDKEVLNEEDEDVLENVNILDEEKAAENILNKKKSKAVYNPYDIEDDELGEKNLLSKYDEEIEGKKKDSFKIGSFHKTDVKSRLEELKKQEIAGKIKFSLEDASSHTIASEFFTHEEMAQFKKPKKKRKKSSLRKKEVEEDLLPLDTPSTSTDDRGSRKTSKESSTKPSTSKGPKIDLTAIRLDIDQMDVDGDEEDPPDVLIDDEAEKELQEALEKARKMKEKSVKVSSVDAIARRIKQEEDMDAIDSLPSSSIILDTTAEFCRNLGDLDSIPVTIRSQEEADKMDFEDEEDEREVIRRLKEKKLNKKRESVKTSDRQGHGDWREVDLDAEEDELNSSRKERLRHSRREKEVVKSQPILEEEPDVSVGVAAALKLAKNKGYLDKEVKKSAPIPKKSIESNNYTIEEKFQDFEDRRRDRFASRDVQDFQEKSGYKPDVKLDYVDDHGRLLTPKEAFRVLSHKFHGKGPGKNKIDKREQKLDQESRLRQMSSVDTPLNTVEKLQEKQRQLQLPYVVISGTGTSLIKKGQ